MQVWACIGIVLCLAVNTHTRSVKETEGEAAVEGRIPLHTSFAEAEENPVKSADSCEPNPCKNDGNCYYQREFSQFNARCRCKTGYFGIYCEQCDCEKGICKETNEGISVCTCPEEWGLYSTGKCKKCECGKGANCTFDLGSLKATKVCLCKVGYEDVDGVCSKDQCAENPCKNGGICRIEANTAGCYCISPFTGKLCEIEIPFSSTRLPEVTVNITSIGSSSVMSGGPTENLFITFPPRPSTVDDLNKTTSRINLNVTTVFQRNVSTPVSTTDRFSRDHSLNFTRERGSTVHLTTSTARDLCAVNPCKNGGICRMENNMARCYCISPFTGKLCEKDPCFSNPCMNGGQCKVNGTSFQCKCGFPYSGRFCENDPCSENPCQNGGKCIVTGNSFNCLCKEPYAGILCETDPCVWNPCKNGGICKIENEVTKCFCKDPFTGEFCDSHKNPCIWNPCKNGGICKIENEVPKCFCKDPFTGEFCDSRKNSCVWNPCKNGGICKMENEAPKCFCKEPFTGEFCGSHKSACIWNPCKNGGVCKTENEIVKCFCKEPFAGEFCDSRSSFDTYVITLVAVSGLSVITVTFLSCLLYQRYPAGKAN